MTYGQYPPKSCSKGADPCCPVGLFVIFLRTKSPILDCYTFSEMASNFKNFDRFEILNFCIFWPKKLKKGPKMKDFKWQAFLCLCVTDFLLLWLFRNLISMPQY